MEALFGLVLFGLVLWVFYLILRAVWRAAEARGQSGPLWVLLFLIAPFLSTVFLLVFFPRRPERPYVPGEDEESNP